MYFFVVVARSAGKIAVAVVLLVVVNMVLVIARSSKEFRVSRNIQNAAITAIERISRDIQDAESANTSLSTLGVNPGSLYLDVKDNTGTDKTIEYILSNGQINLEEDGINLGPITPNNVEVTSLVFYVGSTGLSQMIRAEIGITSSIGTVSKSENFYITAVARGSY